jgi:hypothetical protein
VDIAGLSLCSAPIVYPSHRCAPIHFPVQLLAADEDAVVDANTCPAHYRGHRRTLGAAADRYAQIPVNDLARCYDHFSELQRNLGARKGSLARPASRLSSAIRSIRSGDAPGWYVG